MLAALFAADMICVSGREKALPAGGGSLAAALRAFAVRSLAVDVDAGDVAALTSDVLRFHGAFVTTRGGKISGNWIPYCDAGPARQARACPSCGRTTQDEIHQSRLYPAYRRRLCVCAKDGIVVDVPEEWAHGTVAAAAHLEGGRTRFAARAAGPHPPGSLIAVALERQGFPGVVGPEGQVAADGAAFSCAVTIDRALTPGIYWLCLVRAHDADYGYLRVPVELGGA